MNTGSKPAQSEQSPIKPVENIFNHRYSAANDDDIDRELIEFIRQEMELILLEEKDKPEHERIYVVKIGG